MKKRHILILSSLAFIGFVPHTHAFSKATTPNWHTTLITGYGTTHTSQTQTVRLANLPTPGLDNRYVGGNLLYGSVLIGAAIERTFNLDNKNTYSSAGLEFDYMRNLSVNGRVKPMYNISPNFDVLKYFYDIHTFSVQLSGKLIKKSIFRFVDGYLQAGAGVSINRVSNYHEYAPSNSTASPMLEPFRNKNSLSPCLSAGTGIAWAVMRDQVLSIGYRFVYAGRGRLDKSPIQQTSNSIVLSPITYNFLTLSLSI